MAELCRKGCLPVVARAVLGYKGTVHREEDKNKKQHGLHPTSHQPSLCTAARFLAEPCSALNSVQLSRIMGKGRFIDKFRIYIYRSKFL